LSHVFLRKRVQLDGCIVCSEHNTVFDSNCSAICAQAVYFLHLTRPSVTWLNSQWWLAACDWVMSALCPPASDVSENLGRFLVRSVQDRGITYFKLIPTVKTETRNPVVGYSIMVVNFRRSAIIVELWWPEVARSQKCL